LNIIESFATGIQRIRNLYREYPEKPKFKVYGNSISVVLPKINYKRKDISDSRIDDVIAFLKNQPRSRIEIQEMLQLGKTKTTHYLVLLQEMRLVERIGNGPNTKYQLVGGDVIGD